MLRQSKTRPLVSDRVRFLIHPEFISYASQAGKRMSGIRHPYGGYFLDDNAL